MSRNIINKITESFVQLGNVIEDIIKGAISELEASKRNEEFFKKTGSVETVNLANIVAASIAKLENVIKSFDNLRSNVNYNIKKAKAAVANDNDRVANQSMSFQQKIISNSEQNNHSGVVK